MTTDETKKPREERRNRPVGDSVLVTKELKICAINMFKKMEEKWRKGIGYFQQRPRIHQIEVPQLRNIHSILRETVMRHSRMPD